MAERDYAHASVVVFDPISANLRATRQSLTALGFRTIECVSRVERLNDALLQTDCHLIIADVTDDAQQVMTLMRSIRRGSFGRNPFVPVILTLWRGAHGSVRQAMDTGSDAVLLRPFSTSQLGQRVGAIIQARKGFVVTGDYIGPDRRSDATRPSSADLFHPPNALKAHVEQDLVALATLENDLEASRQSLNQERMRRLAMRVVTAARLRLSGHGRADAFGLVELDEAASELCDRLAEGGKSTALNMAQRLRAVTAEMRSEDEAAKEPLELARDLAIAAFAAFAGDKAVSSGIAEIERAVKVIQARIADDAAA